MFIVQLRYLARSHDKRADRDEHNTQSALSMPCDTRYILTSRRLREP